MFIINDEFSNLLTSSKKYSEFKMLKKFDGFNYSKGKNITIKFLVIWIMINTKRLSFLKSIKFLF